MKLELSKLTTTLGVCVGCLVLQSCIGWGDLFSERRSIGGGFYLMHRDGDEPHYYLFEEGHSGSISGQIICIGWDRDFILLKDSKDSSRWIVLDERSGRSRVPSDPLERQQFAQKLGKFIEIQSPENAWQRAS